MAESKRKVKGAVITEVGKMEMWEFPYPEIGDNDALMRVEMVAICGTEQGIYLGKNKVQLPLLPGHEVIGRIEEIGKVKSERTGIKAGDRVVVETRFGCGVCEPCIKGQYNKCVHSLGYGYKVPCTEPPYLWGAYSEFLYIPERGILHKISEDVPAEAGVLTCAVLGNSVRWLTQVGGCKLGDTVVILGPGRQGLGLVVAAKEAGASKIIITGTGSERDHRRLEMAKELGADYTIDVDAEDAVERVKEITGGKLADVVVDVTGNTEAATTTVYMTKPNGTIVFPGLYGGKLAGLDLDKVTFGEMRLLGAHTHNMDSVEPAIRIIESGKYPLEKMVTHHFPLEQAELAVKTAAGLIPGEEPINVVIVPGMKG